MKYWKKSNGQCGTMDNEGYVPDSVEIEEGEYHSFVATLPPHIPINEIIELEDMKTHERRRFMLFRVDVNSKI